MPTYSCYAGGLPPLPHYATARKALAMALDKKATALQAQAKEMWDEADEASDSDAELESESEGDESDDSSDGGD